MRTRPLLVVSVALLSACGSGKGGAGSSGQPPASNTGFFGIASVGAATKLYMPAPVSPTSNRALLAVVDAAAPAGTSGLIRFVDLGVDGAPQAVGASGQDVVAVDVSAPTVYFVDAATDTVRGTAALPIGAQPIPSSDNSSFSMGVAVDASRRRAWASVSYGLVAYDLDTRLLADTVSVPPTENFALDTAAGRILAPFYLCDPAASGGGLCVPFGPSSRPALTDSVSVVDLASGKAYSLVDPAAADTHAPLGLQPDALAVDFGLGVAAVSVEEPSSIRVLDVSGTQLDAATLTCRVPTRLTVTMPGPQYTAVAADAVTHLAVSGQELAAGIAFVDLAKAKQGSTSTLATTMPDLPDGTPFQGRADPHGAGVGIVGGKPFAFLVSIDRAWVARIDLQGVAAIMAGTSAATFASQVAYIAVPTPP